MMNNQKTESIYKDGRKIVLYVDEVLGSGNFGIVLKSDVYSKQNPNDENYSIKEQQQYATKVIDMRGKNTTDIERECSIVIKVQGKYIATVRMAFFQNNYLYIVSELCNQGTLGQYLKQKQLSYYEKMVLFSQIVEGYFESLFTEEIIHRDLKLENILMHNDIPKICDFGLAKDTGDSSKAQEHTQNKGSPIYTSPQILKGDPYSHKADIYSLGVLLYKILYNRNFNDIQNQPQLYNFHMKLWNGQNIKDVLKFHDNEVTIPQITKDLILAMMQGTEEQRIDIFDLKSKLNIILKQSEQVYKQTVYQPSNPKQPPPLQKQVLPQPQQPGYKNNTYSSNSIGSTSDHTPIGSVNDQQNNETINKLIQNNQYQSVNTNNQKVFNETPQLPPNHQRGVQQQIIGQPFQNQFNNQQNINSNQIMGQQQYLMPGIPKQTQPNNQPVPQYYMFAQPISQQKHQTQVQTFQDQPIQAIQQQQTYKNPSTNFNFMKQAEQQKINQMNSINQQNQQPQNGMNSLNQQQYISPNTQELLQKQNQQIQQINIGNPVFNIKMDLPTQKSASAQFDNYKGVPTERPEQRGNFNNQAFQRFNTLQNQPSDLMQFAQQTPTNNMNNPQKQNNQIAGQQNNSPSTNNYPLKPLSNFPEFPKYKFDNKQ